MAKRSLPFPSLDFSQTCLSLLRAPIIRYQQRSTPLATIGFLEVCEKFKARRLIPALARSKTSVSSGHKFQSLAGT